METAATTEVGRYLPGAVLIGAAAIMIAGAAIGFVAPSLRDAPPFVTVDAAKAAEAIAGNPSAWMWANGLIGGAAIVTAVGLVPITLRFGGKGRALAMVALVAYVFAAAFQAIDRLITIRATTWVVRYADPAVTPVREAIESLDLLLGSAFAILAFAALSLYGLALLQVVETEVLGWAFVAVGIGGIVLELAGGNIPAFVFLATAAFGVASWRL